MKHEPYVCYQSYRMNQVNSIVTIIVCYHDDNVTCYHDLMMTMTRARKIICILY